ncbi:MAG: SDR family NAD(P)-dependent oxidoreductase [Gammaproteobacteria bacterium]|nr:SDR family NAD(P)-dependent oxidoreductase [Gammaproteobacteria bacterium]
MQDLAGKVAFITGGASGIGLAMADAFADSGMKLVIADVDTEALAAVAQRFRGRNVPVLTLELDVTDRVAFAAAADRAYAEFGAVHVLCNNAGVYRGGTLDRVTYEDWDWVLGVNVGGVVNGIQTLLPRMRDQGEGGHIVNTASMAGLSAGAGLGVYNASKYAVVGLSEALRADLVPHGIGVSVLCPGMVRTGILESERNRPAERAADDPAAELAAREHNAFMQAMMASGIDADDVARVVLEGVRENRFWLLSHPEMKPMVEARSAELLAAFGEPDPQRLATLQQVLTRLQPGS